MPFQHTYLTVEQVQIATAGMVAVTLWTLKLPAVLGCMRITPRGVQRTRITRMRKSPSTTARSRSHGPGPVQREAAASIPS